MTLYAELLRRGLLEVPNEEAATAMGSITSMDIVVPSATTWMREELLWYWSSPDVMSGSIQLGIESGVLSQLVESLGELWSSLFGQSASVLRTYNSAEIAARLYAGWEGLVLAAVATESQMDAFYALGGGLMFPDCSADDVQKAKDDEAAREAAAKAEEERIERELALNAKWENALAESGFDEAMYNGDEAALIVAVQNALALMG